MRNLMIAGIVLAVLGIAALGYQGITYRSQREVVDLGPIKIKVDEDKNVPVLPILGGLALVGGVVLIIANLKRV